MIMNLVVVIRVGTSLSFMAVVIIVLMGLGIIRVIIVILVYLYGCYSMLLITVAF